MQRRWLSILCMWRFLVLVSLIAGCGQSSSNTAVESIRDPVPTLSPKPVGAKLKTDEEISPQPNPPAEGTPAPTIFPALQLAKILDLTKLPVPQGAEVRGNNPAHLEGKATGKVPDLASFYLDKLAALGWKPGDGPGEKEITDEYAQASLHRGGHITSLSIIQTNKDKLECLLQLHFRGNLDARTLPRSDGAKLLHGSQMLVMYTAMKPVPAEADWVAQTLAKEGWQRYEPFESRSAPPADLRTLNLRKQGYTLRVFINKAPAQNNQTSVHYSVSALGHELPAPPDATRVRFDDKDWRMECEVPASMDTVTQFYRTAMPAAGYKDLPGEAPQDKYVTPRFGAEGGDVVLVQVQKKGDKNSSVSAFGVSAAMLEKMRKDDEKRSGKSR
jgi:hypothetical protein